MAGFHIIRVMERRIPAEASWRGFEKGLAAAVLCVVMASGCCTGDCARDSGTTYARDALQKYVDSGEIPGAISVFYKDGYQGPKVYY